MPNQPPQYINGDQPAEIEQMIADEKATIAASRNRTGVNWSGIALSGGGIRSAIFCLGALQALAEKDTLKNFDYISSVSGGGFISSSLQWFWYSVVGTDATKGTFPYGTSKAPKQEAPEQDKRLDFLRSHGQYLAPGEGITIWSGLSVIIRTVFLSLIVWIPIGAFFIWLLILLCRLVQPYVGWLPNVFSLVMASVWRADCIGGSSCYWKLELFFEFCIIGAVFLVVAFAVWAVGFSLDTRISPNQENNVTSVPKIVLGVLAILFGGAFYALAVLLLFKLGDPDPFTLMGWFVVGTFFLLFGVLIFLQVRGATASANYAWRRRYEKAAGACFPWTVIVGAIGTLPIVPYLLLNEAGPFFKTVSGAVALVSGLASALFGHNAQLQGDAPSNVGRWALMGTSAVFLYSLGVVSYSLAELLSQPAVLVTGAFAQNAVRAAILTGIVLAIVLAVRTNVNFVGLHRYYRDRLMEAFLPSVQSVDANVVGATPQADHVSVGSLWSRAASVKRSIPYPIINTNCILINDSDREVAWRGGDNFILSPLYVGCTSTGWEDTQRHVTKHGPLTLPTAMAASGAALSENAAYVGSGVTRDRLLSIVMVLLNIRLSVWVGRPSDTKPGWRSEPNYIMPSLIYGVLRGGYDRQSKFMELSDGGHFDNLGIYELIRRKVSVIVVLDGEEDSTLALPGLYSVVQRVQEDFGAIIDLDNRLNKLVLEDGTGYPKGAQYVKEPYFVAPIRYKNDGAGVLIYVKLSLTETAGFGPKGYRAQNADFPQQPTANQFFVPEQVEAYRQVGYENMSAAMQILDLKASGFDGAEILRRYQDRIAGRQ
jgi:patatin-like phospholipase